MIAQQSAQVTGNLTNAILNNPDIATVEVGAPSYLLFVDGLIEGSPKNQGLLTAGAKLNGAYASAFVFDEQRLKIMADKAMDYAERAACAADKSLCRSREQSFSDFTAAVEKITEKNIEPLYNLGVACVGWLQAHSDDWEVIAQLPKAKAILERVVQLDDSFEQGAAHIYLGGIETLLPPAMGGKPEVGKQHFERAIELSNGTNLIAKVIYAKQYARLVFDQKLHHKLLTEVINSPTEVPGNTLINLVAQREARKLLADEADYF
ncbi:MAG: TRAP transporter TatT component family protein [Pseudomonadales bacterium]